MSGPMTEPREALAEAVSNALSAATEGGDFTEAPEPSDEPGSPYVYAITDSLIAAGVTLRSEGPGLEALREAITRLLPDTEYQIETMDGHLRPMRTPADGWECCRSQVLAALAAQENPMSVSQLQTDTALAPSLDEGLREAVRDFLAYDETGAVERWLRWDEKIDALRSALAQEGEIP